MRPAVGYVVIPAYRPDHVLPPLTREICGLGYRVVIVDDGSGEAYREVFSALDPRVTLLTHDVNRGKGAALKTAFAYLRDRMADEALEAVTVATADADGQHKVADLVRVIEAAATHSETLVLGTRVIDGQMPLRSRMGNGITRGVFRLLTGAKVSDTQTGLRAFDGDLLSFMLSVEGDRYEYEMNILSAVAKRFGRKGFFEVPIETVYRDGENSTSHFHPVRDSIRIYRHLLKFVGSSFISFLVDYGLFCLLSWLLGLWIPSAAVLTANVLARIVSATVNYNLNCRVVFEGKPTPKNALAYTLLCGFVLAVNSGVLYLWGLTPAPVWLCKLLTEGCMFCVSYLLQKRIIFRKK